MANNEEVTGFDFYRAIITKKMVVKKSKRKITDDDIKKYYNPHQMNILISFDRNNCLLAGEFNKKMFGISKRLHFLYYYNSIQKRKYAPFLQIRKDKEIRERQELIDIAKKYLPEMSGEKIMDIFELIEDQLIEIQKKQKDPNVTKGKVDKL